MAREIDRSEPVSSIALQIWSLIFTPMPHLSRVAGFYFLGSTSTPTKPITKPNLAPSSSTAAEGKIIRLILEELGHPQPATPVHCDNATAAGIANNSIKKQRSRAMEMRFFWVADQVQRKLFDVHWYPGKENLADYFTKHFDAKHRSSPILCIYICRTPHSFCPELQS